MKVGILGTRGIPNNYGGFEQFTQWLSAGLVARGHEVYVYNSSHHPYQEKTWNGVHIVHCKDREFRIGTASQFFYDLRCNKDAANRNFDILFHFGYSSDSFWWRKWPKNTVNIVNMDGLEWKRTKYNLLTRRFLKKAEAWAALHAQALIADSPGISEYIRATYGKTPVYIPYGTEIISAPNPAVLTRYKLSPGQYALVVARMEPENNIELIIRGWLALETEYPLVIIGNTGNRYGRSLVRRYVHPRLRFEGALYDQQALNSLRYYSAYYFHGHSVGGTNPSLLEAMACGCRIFAHDNIFNRAVLELNGSYFSSAEEIATLFRAQLDEQAIIRSREANLEKIRTLYNPERIINAYEELMFSMKRG